jgi:putative inorganic carbon (hco3(-)) transporter
MRPLENTQYISEKGLWLTFFILLCIGSGFAAVFVNPLIIIGGILVLVNILMVLKYPMWGMLIYLIIFLLRPGEMYPSLAPLRAELLIGLFALISIVIHQKIYEGSVRLPNNKMTILLLGFFLAMILSIPTSYEPIRSKDMCVDFLKLLMFFYLITCTVTTRKRFHTFVAVFLLMIGYIAADAFKGYLGGSFVNTMNVERLTGSTSAGGDPNSLAATMASTIPLLVAVLFIFHEWFSRLFYGGLAILMTALITITASRGGLLAFLGAVLGGIGYTKQKLVTAIVVVVFCVAGWSVLPEQYKARYERFQEITVDLNESSSGRWDIWKAGIQMVIHRPLFGIGVGAFPWAYSSGDFGPPGWLESHNLYIQVAADTGLVGLTLWILWMVHMNRTLKKCARVGEQDPRFEWAKYYGRGILICTLALYVGGMFGHSCFRYTWYLLAGLAVALENIVTAEQSQLAHEDNAVGEKGIGMEAEQTA